MRKTCWHVALEPIPSRYSEQWLQCINREFLTYAKAYTTDDWSMNDILGESIPNGVTSGGFLNFAATNAWKASQIIKLSHMFSQGYIQPNDVFLFTDAWNPAILNVKYMADTLGIPIHIVSYWHAGSYDIWDTLGYKVEEANGNRNWSIAAEKSFYEASNVNLFATEYHAKFFMKHCLGWNDRTIKIISVSGLRHPDEKICVSGQPHYEILEWFKQYRDIDQTPKENIVLFPHRLCKEKQPEIFDELARRNPQFKFLRTQDLNLSKSDYYDLLLRTKVVFSAAQHEMLGISQMEATLARAIPMMPDRLSYSEMFDKEFLYPSEWSMPGTIDIDALDLRLNAMMNIDPYSKEWAAKLRQQRIRLEEYFLTSRPMWRAIIKDEDKHVRA
jgi:hypothetical protein